MQTSWGRSRDPVPDFDPATPLPCAGCGAVLPAEPTHRTAYSRTQPGFQGERHPLAGKRIGDWYCATCGHCTTRILGELEW